MHYKSILVKIVVFTIIVEDDTNEKLEETKINKNKDLPTAKKISGYFIPPQTGEYKFYSSCGAACKIYLSGTDSLNGRRIISQNEKTKPGDFERYTDKLVLIT